MQNAEYLLNNFTVDMGLFFALRGNEEILIIGTEDAARMRLEDKTANILVEQCQESGQWLHDLYDLQDSGWVTTIEGLCSTVHFLSGAEQMADAESLKKIAEEENGYRAFLAGKMANGHVINRYVAAKVWTGYVAAKNAKKNEDRDAFCLNAKKLILPLYVFEGQQERCNYRITNENGAWNWEVPAIGAEMDAMTASVNGFELVGTAWSLLPARDYYVGKFAAQRKCSLKCKVCGKRFFAQNLMVELCSNECREIARRASVANRVGTLAYQIDMLSRREYQHWLNRSNSVIKAGSWNESAVLLFKQEMKQFQKRKNKKNEDCRQGRISYDELMEWYSKERAYLQAWMASH